MAESKSFHPLKFAAKIETTNEIVGSIYDIALKAGHSGDQWIMDELTILLEAKLMAAKKSSKEINVKLPAPSLLDFILRRQKTVIVTVDAYEVMPNLRDSINFSIFDFSNSSILDKPVTLNVTKQRILAYLRKLKRK